MQHQQYIISSYNGMQIDKADYGGQRIYSSWRQLSQYEGTLYTRLGQQAYREHRSLGTPPRLTFQTRLLHNQEDVNTDRYVLRKLSTRSFENRPFRHWYPLGCGAIEPGKSVYGVCQDSDTYGGTIPFIIHTYMYILTSQIPGDNCTICIISIRSGHYVLADLVLGDRDGIGSFITFYYYYY